MPATKSPKGRDSPTQACKWKARERRNEACMTDIHHVLQSITGWGSHGLHEYEQYGTHPKPKDSSIKRQCVADFCSHLNLWKWRSRQSCLRSGFHLALSPWWRYLFISGIYFTMAVSPLTRTRPPEQRITPAPYKETKSIEELKGFLRPHRIFPCFFFSLSRNSEKHSSEWQSVSEISWIIWQPQCFTSNFITAQWMFWGVLQWFLHL